jgi:hypothetical protein
MPRSSSAGRVYMIDWRMDLKSSDIQKKTNLSVRLASEIIVTAIEFSIEIAL